MNVSNVWNFISKLRWGARLVRDCTKFLDHFFVSELLIMMDISSWKTKHDQKYACMFRRQFRVVPRGFSPLSIGDQWRYR